MPLHLVTALLLAACNAEPPHVLLRDRHDSPFQIPILAFDRETQTVVLDNAAMRADGYGSMWKGTSGAPVVVDGSHVGYLNWLRADMSNTNTLGFITTKEVNDWWQSILQVGPDRTTVAGTNPGGSPRDPLAGSMVTTAFVWGDIVAGVSGTVCRSTDTQLMMFGHTAFKESAPGNLRLAVIAARRMFVTREFPDRMPDIHLEARATLGSTELHSANGILGSLGEPPPAAVIRIRGSNRWWRPSTTDHLTTCSAALQPTEMTHEASAPILTHVSRAMVDPRGTLSVAVHHHDGSLTDFRCDLEDLENLLAEALTLGSRAKSIDITIPDISIANRPERQGSVPALSSPHIPATVAGHRRVKATVPGQHILIARMDDAGHPLSWRRNVGCLASTDDGDFLLEEYIGRLDTRPDHAAYAAVAVPKAAPRTYASDRWVTAAPGGQIASTEAVRIIAESKTHLIAIMATGEGAMFEANYPRYSQMAHGTPVYIAATRPQPSSHQPEIAGTVAFVDRPYVIIAKPSDFHHDQGRTR